MSEFDKYLSESKERYKGTFNWHGENHELYTHAASEAQAKNFMIRQLAKKLGRSAQSVYGYFNTKANSWNVVKD